MMNDDSTAVVLAWLSIGGARVGAEVCVQWRRLCTVLLRRQQERALRRKLRPRWEYAPSEEILLLPMEFRYYLRTPDLAAWAVARFAGAAALQGLLDIAQVRDLCCESLPNSGNTWRPGLESPRCRGLVASILRYGAANAPGVIPDLESACQLAAEAVIAQHDRKKAHACYKARGHIPKYCEADHRYFKILKRIERFKVPDKVERVGMVRYLALYHV
jgi:hypothetical protein